MARESDGESFPVQSRPDKTPGEVAGIFEKSEKQEEYI